MSRQLKTLGQNGCPNCLLLAPCGGHWLELIYHVGCANFSPGSVPVDTDDMNPNFPQKFWKLWADTDGLLDYSIGTLRPIETAGLPSYIPLLQGPHLRASKPLNVKVVAIPLFNVIGKLRGGGYGVRFRDPATLRSRYSLPSDARILLVGVDHDRPIETFWAKHRRPNVLNSLAALGLDVSVPNFSFFTCVPRFQILRNRKRILLAAERLSQAGVHVSVHFNANTDADWAFWLTFLQEHPEVACVTVEFQTGALIDAEFGNYSFKNLVDIQNQLGRPLHFLLVGAARFFQRASDQLAHFSVIDSRPFMCTQKRQILVKTRAGAFVWKQSPTRKGASLISLFESNLTRYREMIRNGAEQTTPVMPQSQRQVELLY